MKLQVITNHLFILAEKPSLPGQYHHDMKETHIKDKDRSFLNVENKPRWSWNLDWKQVVNLHGKYISSSRTYISKPENEDQE